MLNGDPKVVTEATMALADDSSPVFTARGMNAFAAMFRDIDKIKSAFMGDGGATTTRACSRGPSGSFAPAIARTFRVRGSRRWRVFRRSSKRGRANNPMATLL
jgi:hypothetical protein